MASDEARTASMSQSHAKGLDFVLKAEGSPGRVAGQGVTWSTAFQKDNASCGTEKPEAAVTITQVKVEDGRSGSTLIKRC